jgi:hypothetical protein
LRASDEDIARAINHASFEVQSLIRNFALAFSAGDKYCESALDELAREAQRLVIRAFAETLNDSTKDIKMIIGKCPVEVE